MNIRRPLSPPFIRSMILLSTLILSTCLLAHLIDFDPYLIMERLKASFFFHTLRAFLKLFGLEMPFWILLSLVSLVGSCSSFHMDENSAGGQPATEQDEANLSPSPGWPTLWADSSGGNSVSSSEPSVTPASTSNQPPRVVPYPYQLDEVIGGDSVESIQRRLLEGSPFPSAHAIQMARIEAEDLFEAKVDICRVMAVLDPTGDWEQRGARALENPRSATGEASLEKLHTLLSDLESRGVNSESFSQLKGKVPLRRGWDEHEHSTT